MSKKLLVWISLALVLGLVSSASAVVYHTFSVYWDGTNTNTYTYEGSNYQWGASTILICSCLPFSRS